MISLSSDISSKKLLTFALSACFFYDIGLMYFIVCIAEFLQNFCIFSLISGMFKISFIDARSEAYF